MDNKSIFSAILELSIKNKYPDIHLNTGLKPFVRETNGEIEKIENIIIDGKQIELNILSKNNIEEIIKIIAGAKGFEKFKENFELDTSYQFLGERYRINCYIDSNGYSIAMRLIPSVIPTMEELGLPESIKELAKKGKGLILITGPTGSGKSTTLASIINYINNNFKKHIITIEEPIEFSFQANKCLINQREVGNHTKGFKKAIKSSLREDPDIIMVGEMRDPETIKSALTLAETGHLVISTLHTNDTVQSVDRIVNVFPANQQGQIKMQLALSLLGIISQKLLAREDDKNKRIAAREILLNNDAIKNLIITGKTHQIYSVIEVSGKKGMFLMDKYLQKLYEKKIISKETLFANARDSEGLKMLID